MKRKASQDSVPHGFIFAGILALMALGGGTIMTFVIASRQESEWRRIQSYPQFDADSYAAVTPDEHIVVTGRLSENRTMTPHELVAYQMDEWSVSTDEDGLYEGSWQAVEENVPALSIVIDGGMIKTAAVKSVKMSGESQGFIQQADSGLDAFYDGQPLPQGSLRTQGFRNRDLVTVVGRKTIPGDIRPDRFHAGNRDGLVRELRLDAKALRFVEVVIMAFAALALGLVLWRWTRQPWWSTGR